VRSDSKEEYDGACSLSVPPPSGAVHKTRAEYMVGVGLLRRPELPLSPIANFVYVPLIKYMLKDGLIHAQIAYKAKLEALGEIPRAPPTPPPPRV
jgi:hypothetical protein